MPAIPFTFHGCAECCNNNDNNNFIYTYIYTFYTSEMLRLCESGEWINQGFSPWNRVEFLRAMLSLTPVEIVVRNAANVDVAEFCRTFASTRSNFSVSDVSGTVRNARLSFQFYVHLPYVPWNL